MSSLTMSSLPNDIFYNVTNFLPNDDITDLMLMSKNFNAHVSPRLNKIDEEMATMNQSVKIFMTSPVPEPTDHEWISQLNLKRFEPVGSKAKRRMKHIFENQDDLSALEIIRERMSLERFADGAFVIILSAFISAPKFRQEYNVSDSFTIKLLCLRQMICNNLHLF